MKAKKQASPLVEVREGNISEYAATDDYKPFKLTDKVTAKLFDSKAQYNPKPKSTITISKANHNIDRNIVLDTFENILTLQKFSILELQYIEKVTTDPYYANMYR